MKRNIFLCICVLTLFWVSGCGNTALQEPASELAVRETADTEDTSGAMEVQEATEETVLETENRKTRTSPIFYCVINVYNYIDCCVISVYNIEVRRNTNETKRFD